jgi:nitrogen regulatory protein P-II 1
MKKIEAIVRKEKFESVYKALESIGIGGLTAVPAHGFGNHRSGLKEKMKIDIFCDEFQVDLIVETIRKTARTGLTGDGKIAVLDLEKLYRIRTGEEGASSI